MSRTFAPPTFTVPIDRPIFVIGTGRSGTTLFFKQLCFHRDVGWFSNYGNRMPQRRWPALLSRFCDLPGIDRLVELDRRAIPRPAEAYAILNALTEQRFTLPRRLDARDATPEIRERFRERVASVLRLQGKTRFAHKHTGFARTRFLDAIFPDARFIDVHRDGRAVAASLAQVDWWRGPDSWRWGPMRPEYREEYLRSGRDRLVLAAISWKTLMDEIEEKCRELPAERFLRIRYDTLIRDPRTTLERVLRFGELEDDPRFWRRVERHPILDTESKWRRTLERSQRELLERCLWHHLEKYGFKV